MTPIEVWLLRREGGAGSEGGGKRGGACWLVFLPDPPTAGISIGGEPACYIVEQHLSRFVEGQVRRFKKRKTCLCASAIDQ